MRTCGRTVSDIRCQAGNGAISACRCARCTAWVAYQRLPPLLGAVKDICPAFTRGEAVPEATDVHLLASEGMEVVILKLQNVRKYVFVYVRNIRELVRVEVRNVKTKLQESNSDCPD